jgi:hypothetical protein
VIQRLVCVVTFLVLTAEVTGFTFERKWSTPWRYVTEWLFGPIPGIRLWWLDLICIAIMVVARTQRGAQSGRAKPVQTAIFVSIGALFAWAFLGAFRGGSLLDMRLQLHAMVLLFVIALMHMNALRTPEHFRMLGKTIVYAALFRAVMMFLFYILVMRSSPLRIEAATDHGDTITFVVTIAIVIANAIHSRKRKAIVGAVLITAVMLWCIQTNNRRLAWSALIGSLLTMYFMIPTGPVRRKIHRRLAVIVPIVGLYVALGWSHPAGIFKPLASLHSINDSSNLSTRSRALEDLGLVVTLRTGPLIGTGFGQKYIEVSNELSAVAFPQYRYVPHNSVLGLAAFTGALGFIGIWMIFPIAAYFAARAYSFGRAPLEKTISMVALAAIFIHINQMWGDIGINAVPGLVVTSGALAAASRMAVHTGAWPGKTVAQKRAGKARMVTASDTTADEREL